MIKFIPYHENTNDGTFPSFMKNKYAILEIHMAKAINAKNIPLKCEKEECAGNDSEVAIDLKEQVPSDFEYRITKYCCEDFNERLKRFLSDRDTAGQP